jgi:photosystem II stability/assembly factor-like uncharacterized protein
MKLGLLLFIGFFLAGISNAQHLQWKEFETPVKASLRGLSPVSDLVCWASGSGGTWLRTTDGGKTWDTGVIAGLDTLDFRSIHAFDENAAVAASAGQPAVIFRTVNGGKSWEKVHEEGPDAFFDGITFLNETSGFIIGDPVGGNWMILETLDAGKSWKAMASLPPSETGEAAFAASASSMIITENELIFGTGGKVSNLYLYRFESKVWKKEKTPILQGRASQGIFALVKTENAVLAVGGDYEKLDFREKNAFRLSNQSYQFPIKSPLGFRSGIAFFPKEKLIIAVGPSGSDLSKDDGLNWDNFSSTGYHAVRISLDQKSVWASGSQGRIGLLIHQ